MLGGMQMHADDLGARGWGGGGLEDKGGHYLQYYLIGCPWNPVDGYMYLFVPIWSSPAESAQVLGQKQPSPPQKKTSCGTCQKWATKRKMDGMYRNCLGLLVSKSL